MNLTTTDIMDSRITVFNIRNLRRIDLLFATLVLCLAVIGLFVLYSASRSISSDVPYYLKQASFLLVGSLTALLFVCVDYRFLLSIAPTIYIIGIVLLLGVMAFGTTVKGGQRWLTLGPLRLQPSEQMKLVLVFMLAWYLAKIGPRVRKIPYFLLTFVIAAIPAGLILIQPNLSTAVILGPVAFTMLHAAGCKRWHLAAIMVVGLAVIPIGWSQMKDYQKDRVHTFLNPEADPQGKGWQTIQSKITVGSGGLAGKGWRKGTQTYLRYLPEHHTDFIFSHVAEEHGFVGAVTVIGLFAALLLRALHIARSCPDMGGTLIVVGIATILSVHVFINIAITVGLMPVTGIPLPFLSYGGSFYMTTMMCVGAILNVHIRKGWFDT